MEFSLAGLLCWRARSVPNGGTRLFLGNPPYTRYHDLSVKARDACRRSSQTLVPDGMASLSTYFLAATLLKIRPDDAIVFLLPTAWTEARYGRAVMTWLWKQGTRQIRFTWFPHAGGIFPSTRVRAVVLAVGPVSTGRARFASQLGYL